MLVLRLTGKQAALACRSLSIGAHCLAFLVAALVFAVIPACGGDVKPSDPGPAGQTTFTPTLVTPDDLPSVPGYARPPATGIDDLDAIVSVLANRNLATTSPLLGLQYLKCQLFREDVVVPPCPQGVNPGTVLPVLPVEGCGKGFANADTFNAYLQGTNPPGSRVYAVFSVAPTTDANAALELRIVVATPRGLAPTAIVVSVANGKIAKLIFPCSFPTPSEVVAGVPSDRFLIPPPR